MAGGRCQAGYARGALERISTRGGFSGWPHGSLRSTRAGPWVLAAREQSVNDPSDLIQIEGLFHAGGSRRREKAPLLRVQEVPGDEDQPTAELGEAPLEGAVKFDAVQHGHLRVGQNQVVASALERSEEHTSELQSLAYLVCRLLLEKKK